MGVAAQDQVGPQGGIDREGFRAVDQEHGIAILLGPQGFQSLGGKLCRRTMVALGPGEGLVRQPQQGEPVAAAGEGHLFVFQHRDPHCRQTLAETLVLFRRQPGLVVAGNVVSGSQPSGPDRKGQGPVQVGPAGVDEVAGEDDEVRLGLGQLVQQPPVLPAEPGVVQVGQVDDPQAGKGGGQVV